jgi:hypothetical protein
MGVPTLEVGYISATTGRGDHEVHKGHVVALEKNSSGPWDDWWDSTSGQATTASVPSSPIHCSVAIVTSWFRQIKYKQMRIVATPGVELSTYDKG